MKQTTKEVKVDGTYNFAGYDWLVLEVQEDKALLLSEYVLERRAYHESSKDITWETSDIRSYLNSEFYNNFAEADKARIAETQVKNSDNLWFGAAGGNDTTDKIFLLSLEEVIKYLGDSGQFANEDHPDDKWSFSDRYDEARVAINTRTSNESWWWLRTPGINSNSATCVNFDGRVHVAGYYVSDENGGIRPAMWVSLESCYECDTYDLLSVAINDDWEDVKVCSSCLDAHYFFCEDCNKYHYRSDSRIVDVINADDHHVLICDDCLDKGYLECRNCGWIHYVGEDFSGTQDEFLCHYCAEKPKSK